jgi:hypothetical protein
LESIAELQPQLQPALLRLSARFALDAYQCDSKRVFLRFRFVTAE